MAMLRFVSESEKEQPASHHMAQSTHATAFVSAASSFGCTLRVIGGVFSIDFLHAFTFLRRGGHNRMGN